MGKSKKKKMSYELRVTSDLRVQFYKLRIQIHKLQFKFTQVTSSNPKVTRKSLKRELGD